MKVSLGNAAKQMVKAAMWLDETEINLIQWETITGTKLPKESKNACLIKVTDHNGSTIGLADGLNKESLAKLEAKIKLHKHHCRIDPSHSSDRRSSRTYYFLNAESRDAWREEGEEIRSAIADVSIVVHPHFKHGRGTRLTMDVKSKDFREVLKKGKQFCDKWSFVGMPVDIQAAVDKHQLHKTLMDQQTSHLYAFANSTW